jgi:hypothetical protein
VRFVVLPAKSLTLKINDPLPVKRYSVEPLLLSILIVSLGLMTDTLTQVFVGLVLSYCRLANGAVLSIVFTTTGIVFDIPFSSTNLYSPVPLLLNVTVNI